MKKTALLLALLLTLGVAACDDDPGTTSDVQQEVLDTSPAWLSPCAEADIACVCEAAWTRYEAACGATTLTLPLDCQRADLPTDYTTECAKLSTDSADCWPHVETWATRCEAALDACDDFGRCTLYDAGDALQ